MIAVPCIYFRTTFNTLFWIYTAVVVILIGCGVWALQSGAGTRKYRTGSRRRWLSPFLIIALLVIAGQMCVYIFGMHLDEDDARWIAEANDALVKNKMLLHNPATGEYIGRFVGEMVKDVFSPWCMYLAWLSRATGIKAVVIAHTVYPPILLGLSYTAYYEIGAQLFEGEKKRHERAIFLLIVSVINLFFAGNVYTQSVFTLTRIWQGKAVVAAVMIPAIMMVMLRVQRSTPTSFGSLVDWLLLVVAGTCCCLFSGMGIAIGLLMIGVYGAYVVVRMIAKAVRDKRWRQCIVRICLWVASIAPGIVYGLGYLWLKG